MTMIKEKDLSIEVDEEGFLEDSKAWDEDTAKILAKREGIADLTDEKLAIVKFLRNYYLEFEAFPILNYVCKNLKQTRGCVNEEFINPMKAWKIAGLPKPGNIHFVSVNNGENYIMEECC